MLGLASGRIRSSQETYKSPQEAPRPLTGERCSCLGGMLPVTTSAPHTYDHPHMPVRLPLA
jgi:hypothetical protein